MAKIKLFTVHTSIREINKQSILISTHIELSILSVQLFHKGSYNILCSCGPLHRHRPVHAILVVHLDDLFLSHS